MAEIAPAASGGLLWETTAGEESRTEGGDKTKIHELIVGENLSKQWGEPQPARISIYRGPILRLCRTKAEVIREVRDTLVHELGHHVGLSDEEMPY